MEGGLADECGAAAILCAVSASRRWSPSRVHTSQVLPPQAYLGRVSQLSRISRIFERQPETCVRVVSRLLGIAAGRLVLVVCGEQVLGVASEGHSAQRVDALDAVPQPLLQAIAEALTGLARPSQLDGELLAGRRLRLGVWDAVPRGDGQGEHVTLAVQALHPPDGAQGEREAVAGGPCAMCLPREAAGQAGAGRVDEAGPLGGEAEVLLAQVQFPNIVVALSALPFFGAFASASAGAPRGRVGLESKLRGDLLERVLRVGQPELIAEEGRFGRTAVARSRSGHVAEGGLDQLLGPLHQIANIEHGGRSSEEYGLCSRSHVCVRVRVPHCAQQRCNRRSAGGLWCRRQYQYQYQYQYRCRVLQEVHRLIKGAGRTPHAARCNRLEHSHSVRRARPALEGPTH